MEERLAKRRCMTDSCAYTALEGLSLGSLNLAPPLTSGCGTYLDLASKLTHRRDVARHTKVDLLDTPINRADTPSMGVIKDFRLLKLFFSLQRTQCRAYWGSSASLHPHM